MHSDHTTFDCSMTVPSEVVNILIIHQPRFGSPENKVNLVKHFFYLEKVNNYKNRMEMY